MWALEPLDARSAVAELATVMCGGDFEVMQMSLAEYDALPDPLPVELTRVAIARMRRCVAEAQLYNWQHAFLTAAIDLLEARRA